MNFKGNLLRYEGGTCNSSFWAPAEGSHNFVRNSIHLTVPWVPPRHWVMEPSFMTISDLRVTRGLSRACFLQYLGRVSLLYKHIWRCYRWQNPMSMYTISILGKSRIIVKFVLIEVSTVHWPIVLCDWNLHRGRHQFVSDGCCLKRKKRNYLRNFFMKCWNHFLSAGIDPAGTNYL